MHSRDDRAPRGAVREAPSVYRRRRATALAVLAGLIAALVLAVRSCGDDAADIATNDGPADAAVRRVELPRGGRRIFPAFRAVGFYGAPQSEQLGALGIGTPDEAAARLLRVARGYVRRSRPVLPVFELISTVAAAAPGGPGPWAGGAR